MTFLSISIREKCVPFFPHFHEKLRTRRERERERERRARKRAAAREDDERRSCGDDKRIGENNERH